MLSANSITSENCLPILAKMKPISLREMGSVSLMNRIDTKYVSTVDNLVKVLEDADRYGYRVLEIEGQRLLGYESAYYDTEELAMFTAHRNSKLFRKKVRVRTYKSGGGTYLEIKRKNNHRRTKKKRISIPQDYMLNLSEAPGAEEFVQKYTEWTLKDLRPETTTDFDRITIVNPEMSERVTIDLNLQFSNFRSGKSANLGQLVIFEVKQDGQKRSALKEMLLKQRIFPFRISKYCIAVSLTDPSARIGRFKKKIRYIEKLTS